LQQPLANRLAFAYIPRQVAEDKALGIILVEALQHLPCLIRTPIVDKQKPLGVTREGKSFERGDIESPRFVVTGNDNDG
jgi:hypothetical protein